MSARTARRRRIQMKNGNTHIASIGRPVYPSGPGTKEAAAKRDARWWSNRQKLKNS